MQTPRNEKFRARRLSMVTDQILERGISDERVIHAMRRIEREIFVPRALADEAYDDNPLPIGNGQTISQPYIVAYMTEKLDIRPTDRILEIGTGCGYQTAVLASLAAEIYTIEIVPDLQNRARTVLEKMGFRNIHFLCADGSNGWPSGDETYDRILCAAAAPVMPTRLRDQLADNGKMILPIGVEAQDLILIERRSERFITTKMIPVRFVPLIGESQK